MPIKMRPTANPSSTVRSYGYDPDTQTMRVRFKGTTDKHGVTSPDSTYELDEVPNYHHDGMTTADEDKGGSVGSYYATHLRRGGYKYRKVENDDE